jgi:predicted MFS family arabinose efflux permease
VSFTLLGQADNPARALGFRITSDVAMGGLLLALLPANALGLRGYSAVLALITLLGIGVALRLPKRSRAPRALSGNSTRPTSRAAWLTLLAVVIFNVGAVGDWIFVGFFAEHSGLPAGPAADVIAAGLFAGVVGSLGAVHIAGRAATLRPQLIASALFLLAIPWLAVTSSVAEFGIAGFTYNATWNFLGPFLVALVALRDPSDRLSSLVPAAGGLGTLVSPTLTGALVERYGPPTAALVLMAIVACSLTLYFALARGPRTRIAAPGATPD